jgi:hypothetical protein
VSVETQQPLVFSEVNSLDRVVGCPHRLCSGVLTACGEAAAKAAAAPVVYYNRLWDAHDRRYKEVRARELRKLTAKHMKMVPLTIPQIDLARLTSEAALQLRQHTAPPTRLSEFRMP